MRERKKTMNYGSLVKSICFIIEITRKYKFGEFTTSIVLRNSFGQKAKFSGLVNEIWEVRRVLTQEWYLLDQIRVVYTFPYLAICRSALKPYYPPQKCWKLIYHLQPSRSSQFTFNYFILSYLTFHLFYLELNQLNLVSFGVALAYLSYIEVFDL